MDVKFLCRRNKTSRPLVGKTRVGKPGVGKLVLSRCEVQWLLPLFLLVASYQDAPVRSLLNTVFLTTFVAGHTLICTVNYTAHIQVTVSL